MDLCIVEQNDDAPAGLLAEWAAERGHRVITLRAAEIGAGPWPDPARYGAVIPLGAEQSVERSPDPWIAPEVAFLREAHDRGVPVLGVCFGGQALAAALGGAVHRAATPEIGWLELEPLDGADRPGPVVRVAQRHLHAAARGDASRAQRGVPARVPRGPQHRPAVPSRGHARHRRGLDPRRARHAVPRADRRRRHPRPDAGGRGGSPGPVLRPVRPDCGPLDGRSTDRRPNLSGRLKGGRGTAR